MALIEQIGINGWIFIFGVCGFFTGLILYNWVSNTVSLKFAWQLYQMKKKANKNKIMLKILVPNGKPEFLIKEIAPIIEYKYKENGRDKDGRVLFDYYAVTEMFDGIKVLECRTDDILPRNPYIDTSLCIGGDLVKKNMIDSSKEDFSMDEWKKWIKVLLPVIIVVGIVIVLYSQNQNDTVMRLTEQVANCWASKPVEIIGQ